MIDSVTYHELPDGQLYRLVMHQTPGRMSSGRTEPIAGTLDEAIAACQLKGWAGEVYYDFVRGAGRCRCYYTWPPK